MCGNKNIVFFFKYCFLLQILFSSSLFRIFRIKVANEQTSTTDTTVNYVSVDKASSITLEFGKVTVADTGDYKCMAMFDNSQIESNPATLDVFGEQQQKHIFLQYRLF